MRAHPVEELVELLLLLFEPLADLLALVGVAERLLRRSFQASSCSESLLLVLVEPPGLVAHLGHVLGEAVGGVLAELLPEVVQLPAGRVPSVTACGSRPCSSASEAWRTCSRLCSICWRASAMRSRFSSLSIRSRSSSVSRRICCCWSRSRLSWRSISSRACWVLGGFEGRLELLEPVVQVGLALGELLEAVDHLARLALLLLALRSSSLLGRGGASAPRSGSPRSRARAD